MQACVVEHVPESLVRRWRSSSIFWGRLVVGGVAGFLLVPAVAVVWLPFQSSSRSTQLVVVCITSLLLACLWSAFIFAISRWIANSWSPARLPIVELRGEQLTVFWNGETIVSDIADCRLREGRVWQMKYATRGAKRLPFGDRTLILIDLPPLYCDLRGNLHAHTTVAVGYDDDSLKRWTAALGMDSSTHGT